MTNHYPKTKGWLVRSFMWLVALLAAAPALNAQTEDSPLVLEAGKSYDLSAYQYKKFYAKYTAAESDVVRLELNNNDPLVCYPSMDDLKNATNAIEMTWNGSYSPRVYSFTAEAGKTYYFYHNFMMNAGTVKVIAGKVKLAVANADPANGGEISAAKAFVSVEFNTGIKALEAKFLAGDKITDVSDQMNINGAYVSIDARAALKAALVNGDIQPGEEVQVRLSGICDATDNTNKYDEDGTLTLTYKALPLPAELVSTKGTESDFLSYWIPGSEGGIIELTYSRPLMDDGKTTATLSIGDVESETDYYIENVPVTISGSSVKLNLQGKLRTPATMNVSDFYTTMSLKVANIRSTDGQPTYSTESGSFGGFDAHLNYKLLNYSVMADFTPAKTGASIDGVKNLEIWIKGDEYLEYDGVNFAYTVGGSTENVVVMNSEISKSGPDQDGAYTLLVPVPSKGADTNSQVVVTLSGLKSADGYDHTSDVLATYSYSGTVENAMTLNYATLTLADATTNLSGASMASLPADGIISVSTNKDAEIGAMRYYVYDLNPEDPNEACIKSFTEMQKQDNGSFQAELPISYKLLQGHQYEMTFEGYASTAAMNYGADPIGVASVKFNGTTATYQYSPITLVSITPDPDGAGFASAEDNKVTLTFSGAVELNATNAFINTGMGTSDPFSAIEANDDKTVWTLTIPDYIMTGTNAIYLSVAPVDAEGRKVKGNQGNEEQTFFSFVYNTDFNTPDLVATPADGDQLESLSTITFSYEDGISSYDGCSEDIIVMDRLRNIVATAISYEDVIPEDQQNNLDYQPKAVVVTFDKEITAAGYYTVSVPAQRFIFGSQFNSSLSKATVLTYTVGNPSAVTYDFVPLQVSPAEGQVSSLRLVTLTFEDETGWPDYKQLGSVPSYVLNAAGEKVADVTIDYNNDDYCAFDLTISPEITAEGTYTLVIPEDQIGNSTWSDASFTAGRSNPELTYTYTIGGGSGIVPPANVTITPAHGATVAQLFNFYFTVNDANEANWGSGCPILTCPDGTEIRITDQQWGTGDNEIQCNLPEAISTPGVYTLTVPAGCVTCDNVGTVTDWNFQFTVAGGDTPDPELTPNYQPTYVQIGSKEYSEGLSIDELTNVMIMFSGSPVINEAAGKVLLKGAAAEYEMTATNMGSIIKLELATAVPNGTYTLVIPKGYILAQASSTNGKCNPELSYTFTVGTDALQLIFADGKTADVYTMAGVKVLEAADAAAIKALRPGIYTAGGVVFVIGRK